MVLVDGATIRKPVAQSRQGTSSRTRFQPAGRRLEAGLGAPTQPYRIWETNMKFFLYFIAWLGAWCAFAEWLIPGVPGMG